MSGGPYQPVSIGSALLPGGAVTGTVYTQYAFDTRMNRQPMLRGSSTAYVGGSTTEQLNGLVRGYIVQAQSQAQTDGTLYGCSFLFNPSIVSLQHGIDSNSSGVLPQYRRLSPDNGVYVIGLQSTLDISLYFDRTYEVNTQRSAPGDYVPGNLPGNAESDSIRRNDDPRVIGCLADVNALYRVVGMNDPTSATYTDSSGNSVTRTITGTMQQVPCYLMLGASLNTNVPSWYGYIDSLGVTYTHFSQGMVPMRAQVDIEMTLLPDQG